ncbi:hypothetical protein [Planctomycetes bacterium K23_9]|uniref:ABC-2 family transporter protein n=1 Tax=Stieleria marina TaxID=1930275 RepID=A0A517NY00_9BACT|nr:ABC-2 family transporter protein [Planctomycetes bacterium K23_9]
MSTSLIEKKRAGGEFDSLRWLVWKENRLVAPLFAAMMGILFFVLLLRGTVGADHIGISGATEAYFPLVFPTLFAAGLGLTLIGQEREHKTLNWIQTLPITPSRLWRIKLAVAATWLAFAWALSLACLVILDRQWPDQISWSLSEIMSASQQLQVLPTSVPFWIAQSVFVLIVSFLASWKCESALRSIGLMAAIGCLPIAMCLALGNEQRLSQTTVQNAFWLTVVLIPIAAWFANAAARRVLLPSEPTVRSRRDALAIGDTAPAVLPNSEIWQSTMLSDLHSALVWQTFRSSALTIAVLSLALAAGFVLPLSAAILEIDFPKAGLFLASTLLSPIAVTWLGATVFQGDGSSERLKFLADHGASPTRVFLARHIPFVSVLSAMTVCYTAAVSLPFALDPLSQSERWAIGLPTPLTLIFIGGVSYCVGQWFSQLVRGPVITYLLSPIVSLGILAWLFYVHGQLAAPRWLVAPIGIAVPLLTTWLLMRRFMEDRPRLINFAISAIAGSMILVVPLVPAMIQLRSIDSMSRATRTKLIDETAELDQSRRGGVALALVRMGDLATSNQQFKEYVEQYNAPSNANRQLVALSDFPGLVDDISARVAARSNMPDRVIKGLDELEQRPDAAAIAFSGEWLPRVLGAMELAKQRHTSQRHTSANAADRSTDDDPAVEQTPAKSNAELAAWIRVVSFAVAGFRRSSDWTTQDTADVLEIWLADLLSEPSVSDQFRSAAREALGRLPNVAERNKARRRAILLTWADYRTANAKHRGPHSFANGQFTIEHMGLSPTLSAWAGDRLVEMLVKAGLQATENPNAPEWLEQIRRLQDDDETQGLNGIYSREFRSQPAIVTLHTYARYPSRYWGMPWESKIDQLREQYREQ